MLLEVAEVAGCVKGKFGRFNVLPMYVETIRGEWLVDCSSTAKPRAASFVLESCYPVYMVWARENSNTAVLEISHESTKGACSK